MNILFIALHEILQKKLIFFLSVAAVFVSSGVMMSQITIIQLHKAKTKTIIETKLDNTRKEMERMDKEYIKLAEKYGFNIMILPIEQNLHDFYDKGYASKTMPESYLKKLTDKQITEMKYLSAALEQKIRWPEQFNRTIILLGSSGEDSLLQRKIQSGSAVLGSELWKSLKVQKGDSIVLLGKIFTVSKCLQQLGAKEDITIRIDLREAQQLLNLPHKINIIYALKALPADDKYNIKSLQRMITEALPDTQCIALENKVNTMEESVNRAREAANISLEEERIYMENTLQQVRRFAQLIVPLVSLLSFSFVFFLTVIDTNERRAEIGILRAMGFRSAQILRLFIIKAVVIGFTGAAAGALAGIGSGFTFSGEGFYVGFSSIVPIWLVFLVFIIYPAVTGAVSFFPVMHAAYRDPAPVLMKQLS